MAGEWTVEELQRLIGLRPTVCDWEGCDNRVAHERLYLMGGDPDDIDTYAPVRECAAHAAVPDDAVEVTFVLRQGLIVRPRHNPAD